MNIVEIYKKFPTQEDCIAYLEEVKWKGKPQCPYCKSYKSTPLKKEKRHHCNNCNTSYSVTVRTIFHKTKLDFQKWFLAISLILNARKGISSRQLSRHLNINKDTAWYMGMRIRRAMLEERELMEGIVEMDETYIGGNPRKGTKGKLKRGRGTKKTPVVGIIQRNGRVVAKAVGDGRLTTKNLSKLVRENVNVGEAILMTDEFQAYKRIAMFMPHFTINHQKAYVDGKIHTNTIENFWSILKRGLVGQFHKVSVQYLPNYLDEFCYRYNNRENKDVFDLTISKALGV